MLTDEPVVIIYGVIYLISLGLAVWRRKTFPLGDALAVALIVGAGFTLLVHFIVPPSTAITLQSSVTPAELVFVLLYLTFVAFLLTRGMPPWLPPGWKPHFLRRSGATVVYKLVVFVLIPLAALRLFWDADWIGLGFSAGDMAGQLRSAALLILLLGGFNFLVGGAAAPIRKRQFSGKHVAMGFLVAFVWMLVEVGLVEEFFFRSFLQTRLVAFLDSPASGILAASLLFGLAHVPGIVLRRGDTSGPLGENPTLLDSLLYGIIALSSTGWFMGLLFWRTQSLLAPILVHAAVDAVAAAAEFISGLGLAPRPSDEVPIQE